MQSLNMPLTCSFTCTFCTFNLYIAGESRAAQLDHARLGVADTDILFSGQHLWHADDYLRKEFGLIPQLVKMNGKHIYYHIVLCSDGRLAGQWDKWFIVLKHLHELGYLG